MHLITGGAYQGKTEYAMEHFGVKTEDIFTCAEDGDIDLGSGCVRGIEQYVLACVRAGKDPWEAFESTSRWKNAVLICRDISCGIVPIDPVLRQWREAVGRLLARLSREAESVTRMFCGLPQRLK